MRVQKVEVGRRLGRTTKKLFPQTIVDKIYKTMLTNQAKLDLKKNLIFVYNKFLTSRTKALFLEEGPEVRP